MGSDVRGGDPILPPFSWQQAADHWTFAPVVTCLTIVAAAAYLWGVWRVGTRHPAQPWPWWRTWLFVSGLAVIVVATQSGIGTYDDVLFWDHMIQHLLLIMVAPPLLVLSQPITLLLHASRNPLHTWVKKAVRSRLAAFLTWPPVTIAAYAATIVGTHLTNAMNVVMTNPLAHDAEHALYLLVGYLFFLSVLGREPIRWRIPYPMRILALIVIMPVDTFTGLVLGYSNTGMTGMTSRSWGPSPVDDIHLGGAVMWIGGDAIMLVLIMMVFVAWSKDDRGAAGGLGWLDSVRQARLASLRAAVDGPASPATSTAATPNAPAGVQAGASSGGQASASAAGTSGTNAPGTAERQRAEVPGDVQRAGAPGVAAAEGAAAHRDAGRPSARRADRRDVDDNDEQLAAYNAYLARLGEAEAGRDARRRG
jgi:cytochrome c oxidase assembly factor CtaG